MTQSSPATNSTPTTDLAAIDSSPAPTEGDQQPLADQPLTVKQRWLYGLGAILAVYLLMVAIDALTGGFQILLGPQADWLVNLAFNPFLGLIIGILVTALVQSSSVITSVLVAMVAGGLPVEIAIPMVMGANVGTTLTNTLVSLGYVGDDPAFERGFAAATLHDFFNLFSLLIFFPLELILHPLARGSEWLVQTVSLPETLPLAWVNVPPIGSILLWPPRWLWSTLVNQLPPPWDGALLFSLSIGILMTAVTCLSWLMKRLFTGQAHIWLQRLMGQGSAWGLLSGAGLTALWQSSSITTSLMVPLASAERVSLNMVYPFVLGANLGTCITALLAVLALGGATPALQLALVHLGFNLAGITVIYGLPWLRQIPLAGAQWLSHWVTRYRVLAIVYVLTVFFVMPGSLLAITLYFTQSGQQPS